MRRLALIAAAVSALILGVPAARAADPIMPLSDVQAGMHCMALSVVRGTTISSFNADVIDVVADTGLGGPAILVRVSGPAIDATGLGPGFSGSPVYCKGGDGVSRNAGAIALGLGDYGNKLSLVTPIEAILGAPVTPPARRRALTRRERLSVRPLASPLTIAGLTPRLAQRITAAARARGAPVYAVPAGPVGSFPVQELKPGASLAVGLSSGDVSLGAIGTVTYTDGNSVWGFGHPLDAAGRRALLLQDAYVYTVVNNPNGDIGMTYKLAAPGHDLGTLSGDTLNAVTGQIGALPPITSLSIRATDLDTGTVRNTNARVADEIALGPPVGVSPLRIVAPTALADAALRVLQSDPLRETATMCVRAVIAGHARPLRFCNRYVGDGSFIGNGGILAASDVDVAVGLLDSAQIPGLQVQSLSTDLRLRRGLAQAFLTDAHAPGSIRAGRKLSVTVHAKVVRGPVRGFTFPVTVPGDLSPGRYSLTLSGPGPDGTGGGGNVASLLADLLGGSGAGGGRAGGFGPASFASLEAQFAGLHVYDGLTAVFKPKKSGGGNPRGPATDDLHVYRDPDMRIGGSVSIPVRVKPR